MILVRYSFEDRDGEESGFTTMDPIDGKRYAARHGCRMIADNFEFSDSEVVEDYTADQDDDKEGGDS